MLRQAAIPLGAFAKAKPLTVCMNDDEDSTRQITELSVASQKSYQLALHLMMSDIESCLPDDTLFVRKAMILASLIYCYKCMSGNSESVTTQMKSALKMVATQFSGEIQRYRHFGNTTPAYSFPEQDLLPAFVRLDISLGSRDTREDSVDVLDFENDAAEPQALGIMSIDLKRTVRRIPETFESLHEVRKTIEYINTWALPCLQPAFVVGQKDRVK